MNLGSERHKKQYVDDIDQFKLPGECLPCLLPLACKAFWGCSRTVCVCDNGAFYTQQVYDCSRAAATVKELWYMLAEEHTVSRNASIDA